MSLKPKEDYIKIGFCTDNINEILSLAESHYGLDTRREDGFHSSHKDTRAALLQFNWALEDRNEAEPIYLLYRDLLEPVLNKLKNKYNYSNFSTWKIVIAELEPNGHIGAHKDTHLSFDLTHRCHWILKTNKDVVFKVGDSTLPTEAGAIYEINNTERDHEVFNGGSESRIHVIIDCYNNV